MPAVFPTPLPPGAHELITLALAEDLGNGDYSSAFFVNAAQRASAFMVARETLVVSGLDVAAEVFRRLDPDLMLEPFVEDGTEIGPGTRLLRVGGKARAILSAERSALNFVQRLSGVATLTRRHARELEGTSTRLLDTRKTTPGFRALEKRAVRHGGGVNHRMCLDERVMLKDNHLAAAGDLGTLQERIDFLHTVHPQMPVEIEADTLAQVLKFFTLRGVDRILLDNMDPDCMRRAVAANPGGFELEASGGLRLENLREIAATGVDYVSIGALTHSAPAVDIGLDFQDPGDGTT